MEKKYNPIIAGLQPSPTLSLNAQAKAMAAQGTTVYNLTVGEPDWPTPEYVKDAVREHLNENKYTPAAGLPVLRKSLAEYARALYKVDWITEKNVIVTPGAKPAINSALFALLKPGDEVIVPTPYWVSYRQLVEITGAKFVAVETTSENDLSLDAIEDAITAKTKLIIINSPNNPTGAVYSSESLKKLIKLLKDTDIFVLSDDIYIRLTYQKATTLTELGFDKNRLLIVNGFSKSQALTGWRIGYLIAPEFFAKMVENLNSHTLGNTSLPAQYAAIASLNVNDNPPMINDLVTRREKTIKELRNVKKISFVDPQGAFYIFIDIRNITKDSLLWCSELLNETGVALVPGDDFGAPGFVRLSYATDHDTLGGALSRLKQFIEKKA